jgi:transposase-like protein
MFPAEKEPMSTKRSRRVFALEFKKQIIEEIDSGKATLSGMARKHGISPAVINYWRNKSKLGTLVDRPSKREKELEKELNRYKIKMAELQMENEFLKKTEIEMVRKRRLKTSVITAENLDQFRKDVD